MRNDRTVCDGRPVAPWMLCGIRHCGPTEIIAGGGVNGLRRCAPAKVRYAHFSNLLLRSAVRIRFLHTKKPRRGTGLFLDLVVPVNGLLRGLRPLVLRTVASRQRTCAGAQVSNRLLWSAVRIGAIETKKPRKGARLLLKMVPVNGFEPLTHALRMRCSTN